MKKILIILLLLLLGVAFFYAVIQDWNFPPFTFSAHQEKGDKDGAGSHEELRNPVHLHHEDSDPPESVAAAATGDDAGEHDEQENDDYYYLGGDISQEQYIIALDEMMRQTGADPPHRPYWTRLKELHQMVEARGYKREELFNSYTTSVLARAAPSFVGIELPPDERKRFQRSLEESKTMQLVRLFENQDREAIEEWIKDRRSENEHDIPAIYAELVLNYSIFRIDELFDTVEEMIVALDHFEPSHIPKEAILYETLDAAMNWGSMRESAIESMKQSDSPDKISGLPHWLLFAMELAGDW